MSASSSPPPPPPPNPFTLGKASDCSNSNNNNLSHSPTSSRLQRAKTTANPEGNWRREPLVEVTNHYLRGRTNRADEDRAGGGGLRRHPRASTSAHPFPATPTPSTRPIPSRRRTRLDDVLPSPPRASLHSPSMDPSHSTFRRRETRSSPTTISRTSFLYTAIGPQAGSGGVDPVSSSSPFQLGDARRVTGGSRAGGRTTRNSRTRTAPMGGIELEPEINQEGEEDEEAAGRRGRQGLRRRDSSSLR